MLVNVGAWANALMDRCGVFDSFSIYIRSAKSDQERILAGLAQYFRSPFRVRVTYRGNLIMSVNVGVWANALMDRCGVFDPFWIYTRTAKSDQERILAGLA